jgi:hypothetical protein
MYGILAYQWLRYKNKYETISMVEIKWIGESILVDIEGVYQWLRYKNKYETVSMVEIKWIGGIRFGRH